MAVVILYENNDAILKVIGLKNGLNKRAITNALVEATVFKSGVPLSTGTWPLVVPYVNGSKGDYQVTLPASLGMIEGDNIYVVVDVSGELVGRFEQSVQIQKRGFV